MGDAFILKPFFRRCRYAQFRADQRRLSACAYQFFGGPPSQDRADGINDDGFARSGFAGQYVQSTAKLHVSLLDHRNILNMQQVQHTSSLESEKFLQLLMKTYGSGIVFHSQEHGVISCQTAYQTGDLHRIDGGTGRTGQTRKGFDDDQILRAVE